MCTCIKCSKHISPDKINYMHFRPLCDECYEKIEEHSASKKSAIHIFTHEDLQKQINRDQNEPAYFVAVKAVPKTGPNAETWLYMEQGLGPYRSTLFWDKMPMMFDSIARAKETIEKNDRLLSERDNRDWTFLTDTIGIYKTTTQKIEDINEQIL